MSTGAICVNTLKKDWTSETTFAHVLSVIRCLLIVPFPESSLNDEAGKLFMESYDEYAKRAKLMADVHGKSRSSNSEEEDGENPVKDTSAPESRAAGPLRSTSANTKKSAGGGAKKSEKKSKKKGLKRL